MIISKGSKAKKTTNDIPIALLTWTTWTRKTKVLNIESINYGRIFYLKSWFSDYFLSFIVIFCIYGYLTEYVYK